MKNNFVIHNCMPSVLYKVNQIYPLNGHTVYNYTNLQEETYHCAVVSLPASH